LKVIDRYCTYLESNKRTKPNVEWYCGSTGTGKSKKACEFNDICWKDYTKWWDGYDQHETIVIDDFRASHMKFNNLLRLLDQYPYGREVKGGYRWLNSKNIITTKHPKEVYNKSDEDTQQLMRRITKLLRFE
jgi:hypothetical protein